MYKASCGEAPLSYLLQQGTLSIARLTLPLLEASYFLH